MPWRCLRSACTGGRCWHGASARSASDAHVGGWFSGQRDDLRACKKPAIPVDFADSDAGWSSLAARRAHNPKVAGSNPAPATRSFLMQESLLVRLFCWLQGCTARRETRAPDMERDTRTIIGELGKWAVGAHFLFPRPSSGE